MFAAAALVGLAGCTEAGKETPVLPEYMTSFGFYAEDNAEVLHSDVVVSSVSQSMKVTLPYGVTSDDLKTLVPRFEVTEGATVTVNNETVESGKTAVDFSFPAEFLVTLNEKSTALYTVTVAVASPATWSLLATTDVAVKADPDLTINPADGKPYILGKDNENGYPVLLKLSENKLVSEVLENAEVDQYDLGFSLDGKFYMLWYDKSAAAERVMLYVDGTKTYLGEAGKIDRSNTGASEGQNCIVGITDNNVYAFMRSNVKGAVARRSLNLCQYDGSNWTQGQGLPGFTMANQTLICRTKWVNGVPYVMVSDQTQRTLFLYKYEGNAWVNVCSNVNAIDLTGNNITDKVMSTTNSSVYFDVATNGDIYFSFAVLLEGSYRLAVMKYDIATGAKSYVGGVMSDVSTTDLRYISMALDSNDNPYLVYSYINTLMSPVYVRYIDTTTKLWADPVALPGSEGNNGSKIDFSDDGTGYIAVLDEANHAYKIFSNSAQ